MAGSSKYSLLNRINFEDLYNAFLNLEQRQQVFSLLGAFVFLIVSAVLPITCASSKLSQLEGDYEKSEKTNKELMNKMAAYQTANAKLESLRQKLKTGGGGSLNAAIESIANDLGIKDNVDRLRPIVLGTTDFFEEEAVDGAINRLTLDQVVNFLVKVKQYEAMPLKVKKLEIKPKYNKRSELSVSFQISTLRLKGDGGE